jgi:hypothetical protein
VGHSSLSHEEGREQGKKGGVCFCPTRKHERPWKKTQLVPQRERQNREMGRDWIKSWMNERARVSELVSESVHNMLSVNK